LVPEYPAAASPAISGRAASIKPRRLRFRTLSPFLVISLRVSSVTGGTDVPFL